MADRYVYSGAAGSGTGASWTNAHTTMAAAITAASAGDRYIVADDHQENFGVSTTLTFKGTAAAPDTIICATRTGSQPPVAADLRQASSFNFGTSGNFALTFGGSFYLRGLFIKPGAAGNSSGTNIAMGTSLALQIWDSCTVQIDSSSATPTITAGNASTAKVVWRNVTVRFGAAGQGITCNAPLDWKNDNGVAAIHASSTVPTNLFKSTSAGALITLAGLDLNLITTAIMNGATAPPLFRLVNCKINSGVSVTPTPAGQGSGVYVDLIDCDSGTKNYRNERYSYMATLTTETTIVRTAGATDGTTPFSWKVVTTANNKQIMPFETFEGALWNDTTGSSKTLTVHFVTDNVTLTDAEIWLEVDYLGSSATPISYRIDDGPTTFLTAGASQASDSGESWTTTGLTTPVKQKASVTFTPQMKGVIRWRLKIAKASTTIYVCPNADLT